MNFTNTDRVKEKVGAKRWQVDRHIDNQVNAHAFWKVDDCFHYLKPIFLEITTKIKMEINK
jgi:hypothetical protein